MNRSLPFFLLLSATTSLQAQNLGPDAPEVAISYDNDYGFFLLLTNPPTSNNYQLGYTEAIFPAEETPDPFWRFQGYMVFQFANAEAAEGDVLQNIHDPALARPVLGVDLNDTITYVLESFDPAGPNTCATRLWVLSNSGIVNGLSAVLDPFTNAPYVQGEEYCFLVLAFATNPFHEDAACAQQSHLLFSHEAPDGALQVQCVLADPTAAVGEASAPVFTLAPNPAHDAVRLHFTGAQRRLQVFDARGALCLSRPVATDEQVALDGLHAGIYQFVLTDAVSERRNARVIIE